jgi:hypothetical protein
MSKEAMKLALEALRLCTNAGMIPMYLEANETAIKALEEALAKQEQEVDWKDMYEKEKRRSAMWIAKYEKDIGPLEYAVPAKQEQGEPVAWADHGVVNWIADKQFKHAALLYEHPQQRKWVGLDEEDDIDWEDGGSLRDLVEAVEAKLKEKNGL